MNDQKVRTYSGWAFWLGIAITLGPLAVMPLAQKGRLSDQIGMQETVVAQDASQRTS